tara:strand:+ start:117 stop:563 length:447 start_codon:yes stop_codon:yes gene_type:complete
MSVFNLKKTKRKILLDQISTFQNKLLVLTGSLITLIYLIDFFIDEKNILNTVLIFLKIITFIICYLLNEGKSGFWKRFMPLYVLIHLRYLFFAFMVGFFSAFFDYEILNGFLFESFFEIFLEMMILINIMVNFASINKNYFLINKIKN